MGGKALSEQMWQESLEMLKIEVLLRVISSGPRMHKIHHKYSNYEENTEAASICSVAPIKQSQMFHSFIQK